MESTLKALEALVSKPAPASQDSQNPETQERAVNTGNGSIGFDRNGNSLPTLFLERHKLLDKKPELVG